MKKLHYYFLLLNVSFSFCTKEIWSSKDNTGAALPGVNIEKELLTVSPLIWMEHTKLKLAKAYDRFQLHWFSNVEKVATGSISKCSFV
jgi:hypothetical protein